jgi:hypothetical protein
MQNEAMTGGQEPAFGDGAPGQSWLARSTFGTYSLFSNHNSCRHAIVNYVYSVNIGMHLRFLWAEAYNLMKARGSVVDAGMMLKRWMDSSPELDNVQYQEVWTPIGPWLKGSAHLAFISTFIYSRRSLEIIPSAALRCIHFINWLICFLSSSTVHGVCRAY